MLLTVTLNANVDSTYRVDGLEVGRVNRPSEAHVGAGGKGINVARVYRTLGGDPLAIGLLGGHSGAFIARSLAAEGIRGRFVRVGGESRTCIALIDSISGEQTEINASGPLVVERDLTRLTALLKRHSAGCRVIALCGSLPPGVDAGYYGELIGIARKLGVRVALDASGEALRQGSAARPWMIKPNIHELGQLTGEETQSEAEVVESARRLLGNGTEVVAVTCGEAECVLVTREGTWVARPPYVTVVSTVGSGDSFLAGLLFGWLRGRTPGESLQLAMGAGAANAARYGAGFCAEDEISSLAAQTVVRSV